MQPGSFAAQMPANEDALIRRIQELERDMLEFKASIAGSFRDIGNNALASPQTQVSDFGDSVSFAVPATTPGTTLAVFTMTVPAGYTQASFIAEATAGLYNNTAARNFGYLRVWATGPSGYSTTGSRQNVQIDAGTARTLPALLVRAVNVPLVGGDVLTFYCSVYADTALSADASNFASVAALVTFTR